MIKQFILGSHSFCTVTCKLHGDWQTTPSTLLAKKGCPSCGSIRTNNSRRLTTEQFITKAKSIHLNDLYDYSLVEYKTQNTPITIICKLHNYQYNCTPLQHYRGITKCIECNKKDTSKIDSTWEIIKQDINVKRIKVKCKVHDYEFNTTMAGLKKRTTCCYYGNPKLTPIEETLRKFNIKHKDKGYTYPNLKSSVSYSTKIDIICPLHGSFKQTVGKHMNGHGCSICSFTAAGDKKTQQWLKTVEEYIQNELKDDSLVSFVSSENVYKSLDKFTFTCKTHGIFYKSISNFRAGQRCPTCNSQKIRIWSKQSYSEKCKLQYNGITNLYCIRCFNENEEFYKVGITIHSNIYKRFLKHKFPYQLEVISFITGNVDDMIKLEKDIHKSTSCFRYKPLLNFKGSKTECFTREGLQTALTFI